MHKPLVTIFYFAGVVLAGVVALTIIPGSQAQRPDSQQNPDTVNINTGEVLLDAVVRDKKGRIARDLTAADFEISEDGVRQQITSLRLITPTANNNPPGGRANQQGSPAANDSGPIKSGPAGGDAPGISAIALVFDRLSPAARTSAYKAALSYVDQSAGKEELFGVFLTDLSVVVAQPYTADRQLVKAGIEKAGEHSPSLYNSTNQQARDTRQALVSSLNQYQNPAVAKDGLPRPTTALSLTSAGAMASLRLGMLERAEEDQRDQLGHATVRGLLHITSSLGAIPGRKAVIFFSEGLILPSSVMQTFPAIIDTATRNNVSFYTVDAAGLRVESKNLETGKEIASRSELTMAVVANSTDVDGPMTKGLERNEDLLRLNPDSGLGRLANETGGFLITDSNDLAGKLQKVDEELHSYYLLSYRSNNQNYDGHFRKISVSTKRSGLNVQSRKGYFALKSTFVSPVLSYEAPALAALENQPKANSFPFYTAGFSFPERERVGLVPIIADLPISAFTFAVDQEKKNYHTDFSVVALLKDQSGQVVQKLSRQYRLNGPLEKLDEEKKGRVLFYREADLMPGSYRLETIAYDASSGRSSVRTGAIEVTASDEGKLRLSDVVILSRAEPANTAVEKHRNPFYVGSVIVSPNPGEPIHRSLKQVPFFFTAYIPAGTSAPPKLTVELRQQSRNLAQMPGDLPKPDESGRVQYLAGLPLETIPAGEYELRITVTDGATTVARSVHFTIVD
jgi:VWFA-related protein